MQLHPDEENNYNVHKEKKIQINTCAHVKQEDYNSIKHNIYLQTNNLTCPEKSLHSPMISQRIARDDSTAVDQPTSFP